MVLFIIHEKSNNLDHIITIQNSMNLNDCLSINLPHVISIKFISCAIIYD